MQRRLAPGDWVAITLVAAAHAADLALIRAGHDTISTCARRRLTWRLFVALLLAHIWREWRYDPWTYAGSRWDAWCNGVPPKNLRCKKGAMPDVPTR